MFVQGYDMSFGFIYWIGFVGLAVSVLSLIYAFEKKKKNDDRIIFNTSYPMWGKGYAVIGCFGIVTILLSIAFAVFIPVNNSEVVLTDKLSDAKSSKINKEAFKEKVMEVGHIDSLNANQTGLNNSATLANKFKEGDYVTLEGIKNDHKVNVVVRFKGDKMNVTVESISYDRTIEDFSYIPK